MTRGCAITVYFDPKTCRPGYQWLWIGRPPTDDAPWGDYPICVQGDGGTDWDIIGDVQVYFAPQRPTAKNMR